MSTSLRRWFNDLPWMQQGVLLGAIRNCDRMPSIDTPHKILIRGIRSACIKSAKVVGSFNARRPSLEDLKQASEEIGKDIHRITEPAMAVLMSYDWPGNIRQLRDAVRTMVVMCDHDTLDIRDIPPEIHLVKRLSGQVVAESSEVPPHLAGKSLDEIEKEHIRNTLILTNNNRAEAAKLLKIGERTLYRKIKEYGL